MEAVERQLLVTDGEAWFILAFIGLCVVLVALWAYRDLQREAEDRAAEEATRRVLRGLEPVESADAALARFRREMEGGDDLDR